MFKGLLLVTSLAAGVLSQTATAMPFVYNCRIIDYRDTGAEVTEFTYSQFGQSVTFDSPYSSGRIYLSPERSLAISLRPRDQDDNQHYYSSVNGYDLPKRLSVVLAGPGPTYAAMLSCEI